MQENRETDRCNIIGLAHIRREGHNLSLEAQIANISYSGMRIYVKEPLSGRVEISLYYDLEGTTEQFEERLKAEVTWCQGRGLWYSAGINFDELNPDEHAMTLAFLDRHIPIG